MCRYVKQCETFFLNKHISWEVFCKECLAGVLQLARDKVPNVRIAVAKLLKDSILSPGEWWVLLERSYGGMCITLFLPLPLSSPSLLFLPLSSFSFPLPLSPSLLFLFPSSLSVQAPCK